MNIVPKEYRKMQEFQYFEIPSASKLFGKVQGMKIPSSGSGFTADFTSRKLDQLAQSVYEVGEMLKDKQMPLDTVIDEPSSVGSVEEENNS